MTQAQTQCIQQKFKFQGLEKRKLEVDFSAGHLSSNGGTVLLRELDLKIRLSKQLSRCFLDLRDPGRIEHPLEEGIFKGQANSILTFRS